MTYDPFAKPPKRAQVQRTTPRERRQGHAEGGQEAEGWKEAIGVESFGAD